MLFLWSVHADPREAEWRQYQQECFGDQVRWYSIAVQKYKVYPNQQKFCTAELHVAKMPCGFDGVQGTQ